MTEGEVNETPNWRSFSRRVFTNIEPIIEHAIAVVVLESSVLIVGLVALLLKRWLTGQERFVNVLYLTPLFAMVLVVYHHLNRWRPISAGSDRVSRADEPARHKETTVPKA